MHRHHRRHARQQGFTLIEALVALVITAFGMLALAGFQLSLSTASENAKQRSEAVRLAQQKIDELRSFEVVQTHLTKLDYQSDVVAGGPETFNRTNADVYNTANEYRREWWVTKADGTAADPLEMQKWLRVQVAWTDRNGQEQRVTLRSVIGQAEPATLGTLAVGKGTQNPRSPRNRNVDIPYPAKSLAGSKSAFRPAGASVDYVFDNASGDVLGYCTQSLAAGATVTFEGTPTSGCTAQKAYLLSGYIRFLNGLPTGNETQIDNGLSNPTDTTNDLTASILFTSPMPGGHPTAPCYAERQKVVATNNASSVDISSIGRLTNVVTVNTAENHGLAVGQQVAVTGTTNKTLIGQFTVTAVPGNRIFTYVQSGADVTTASSPGTAALVQQLTIAESVANPNGYNSVISRFVAYSCVIVPYDHDGDEATATTPNRRLWWGQFVITPATGWSLGTSGGSNRRLCRFTGDYIPDDKVSNSEHPLYYRGVSAALDAQNYLVIPANSTCPTDSEIAPLSDDYINTHTVLHQTAAGTTASAGLPSNTSAQWPTTPEPSTAPSTTTDVLPIF
jgi:prepilin-type N-terminal cleavage/methylation domain-containing protein